MANALYYGDNLDVLRESIATESVDLIYLDPPFNSQANYNVLFRSPAGVGSPAQIEAFEDTWHWGQEAEVAFDEVMNSGKTDVSDMLRAMRSFLGENDMMAYLCMMAVRLIELHRVLKQTGCIYLHCDPTASHYLKILMDAVFGAKRFLNEITWKRTSAHNDAARYGRIQDRLLFYSKTKTDQRYFRHVGGEYTDEQLARFKNAEGTRRYKAENLTAPHFSPTRTVEWRGTHPGGDRQWRFSIEELERLWSEGRILVRKDGCPRKDGLKEYLDECETPALQDIWTDIGRIGNTAAERLGYPTQKPLALLERVISVSSAPDHVVLDPFCGCGTAVHAAQKLGRSWIGIDITHLAISLIERRLKDAFPGIVFEVHGTPKDIDGARDLAIRDKYQFQWWAVSLVEAQPFSGKKKGADSGIDGLIYFRSDSKKTERAIVSVKGGEHVSVAMIRDLKGVLEREKAPIGVFLTLTPPTKPMEKEAASAGFYELGERRYSRLQIITIEEALAGRKPAIPLIDTGAAFKKALPELREQQIKFDI